MHLSPSRGWNQISKIIVEYSIRRACFSILTFPNLFNIMSGSYRQQNPIQAPPDQPQTQQVNHLWEI
jgi:hypothetical protein